MSASVSALGSNSLTKRIAILGSTGSIGRNALDVVAHLGSPFRAVALSGHSRLDVLLAQAAAVRPAAVWVTGDCDTGVIGRALNSLGCKAYFGPECARDVVERDDVDIVLSAIVGAAGVPAAIATVDAGKTLALANKEALVVAGSLVMPRALRQGAAVLPVDSEHSAIFQALACGRRHEVRRVILTASGGPFRTWDIAAMNAAMPAEALKHPTWSMGAKVTIDSATMFNKALEMIEAAWLFDLPAEQIDVVVHPQSLVHSMVEFVDGSVIAQLSKPDMRTPIQHALTYPDRLPAAWATLDWRERLRLDFEPPDPARFPALGLAAEVIRKKGTAGCVLNAANEVAVAAFLRHEIAFGMIWRVVRLTMDSHTVQPSPSMADLLESDRWARQTSTEISRTLAAETDKTVVAVSSDQNNETP